MKKIMAFLLIAVMLYSCITTVNVNAATKNPPYGFTFSDASNGRTVYRLYEYSSKKSAYVPTQEFYSKSSKVYKTNGDWFADTYGNGAEYNAFDDEACFYVMTPKLGLDRFKNGKKQTLLKSGCVGIVCNADCLATKVVTNDGWFDIKTLKPVKPDDNEPDDPPAPKYENRVDMYTNSAGELVYEAFQNSTLKLKLVVSKSGSKILNETAGVRLSDFLKGAKFIGIDPEYNVYLYEKTTLYRFKFGSWYSAEKLKLNGTYKSFRNSEDGFVSHVVTTKGTYSIKQLSSADWRAKRTYAVHKKGYITLYIKGKTTSHTLLKSGKSLKLDGKVVARNVSEFGFTSSTDVIIRKKHLAFTINLKQTKLTVVSQKAKSFVTNSVGLVTKIKLTNGKKIKF